MTRPADSEARKIIDLAVSEAGATVLLDDNTILFSGDFLFDNPVEKPRLDKDDYFVQIEAGNSHYIGVTKKGLVYAWGDNTFGQCKISGETANKVYAGAYQSYAVNENNKLVAKSGLKGYLFGTDGNGMDVFKRIISGGRMTLTIGAIAVIISTIIGIIVGCLSGYFGGWDGYAPYAYHGNRCSNSVLTICYDFVRAYQQRCIWRGSGNNKNRCNYVHPRFLELDRTCTTC